MRLGTNAQRSAMMSQIRGKNTAPELALRLRLHAKGYRYRLNVRKLPGSPDIVLPKFRSAIFVHGCFWHRHDKCRYATTPQANALFWQEKFQQNVTRDTRNIQALKDAGWRVAIVWECALKFSADHAAQHVSLWLNSKSAFLELGAHNPQAE